jgi:hypothetical protein
MRRRARTDLCGGRSAMVVPTATIGVSKFLVARHPAAMMEKVNAGKNQSPGIRPRTCGRRHQSFITTSDSRPPPYGACLP